MNRRLHGLAILAVAGSIWAAWSLVHGMPGHASQADQLSGPVGVTAPGPGNGDAGWGGAGHRTACSLRLGRMQVGIRCLGTARVGEEVALEVTGRTARHGLFRLWVATDEGAMTSVDQPGLVWEDRLTAGQTVVHRVRVRIDRAAPIPLTAKMISMDPADSATPAAEAYLRLLPFDCRDGQVNATWNPRTLRSIDEPEPPMVTLSDGNTGQIHRVSP
ncbi:MAG: hypothetical protein HY815_14160 [Candidatus Riflebacteria bacterium]|nr:hypothetical protein [Candidatus Riflebacteria bacterium]